MLLDELHEGLQERLDLPLDPLIDQIPALIEISRLIPLDIDPGLIQQLHLAIVHHLPQMVSSPGGSSHSSAELRSRFFVHSAVLAASGEPVVGVFEGGAHGEVVLGVGEEDGVGGFDFVEGDLDGERDALLLDILVEEGNWEMLMI